MRAFTGADLAQRIIEERRRVVGVEVPGFVDILKVLEAGLRNGVSANLTSLSVYFAAQSGSSARC